MTVTPESINQLLNSPDFGERLRAVNQIRQLEPAIAFDLLNRAIQDQNARVRYAAVSQLSSTGHHNRPLALTILRRCLLDDPEVDVQAAAADSLAALQLVEAFPDLQERYQQTKEWLLQFSIIAALGELGDPRAFSLLEGALDATNELVQMAAIGSLGELGDPKAVNLLVPYADHSDWQMRHKVAQALGHYQGEMVTTTLKRLAQDPVDQVAKQAQLALNPA